MERDEHELPRAVIDALSDLDGKVSVLTPAVDRTIRESAEAHFCRRPERAAPRWKRWAFPGAIAASLLAGLLLIQIQLAVQSPLAADDVDGSGTVDILDAFALARRPGFDSDVARQQEVDALAMRIVSIDARGNL
jgi:hypothetical protein